MFFPAANNRERVRRWQAGRIFQDPVFPFTCEKNLFCGQILERHSCQLVQCMLATPFILPFYAPQLLSFSFFLSEFPLCTKNILLIFFFKISTVEHCSQGWQSFFVRSLPINVASNQLLMICFCTLITSTCRIWNHNVKSSKAPFFSSFPSSKRLGAISTHPPIEKGKRLTI